MKTLVIHPEDHTTDFLKQIYTTISQKTVITGGFTKPELKSLINSHDRIVCLGHGSPEGLMAVGRFYTINNYIIDESMAELLKYKKSSIYIWCNADQYVQKHRLFGFNTGMFISEIEEAICYGYDDIDWDLINASNNLFGLIASKYINEPLSIFYKNLMIEYGLLAQNNPIARFNLERLYYKSIEFTTSNAQLS